MIRVFVLVDLARARAGPCPLIALGSTIVARYWACAVHCGKKSLAKSRFAISLQSACARLPREEHVGGMLLQLTRSMRIRVGRFIALAYLFCVLAPAAALAWGNGPAPCLDDVLLADLVPMHHQCRCLSSEPYAWRLRINRSRMTTPGCMRITRLPRRTRPPRIIMTARAKLGPCCAMMCVSALPADLPSFAKPLQPVSACSPEIVASLHSTAPPLLYRPPII